MSFAQTEEQKKILDDSQAFMSSFSSKNYDKILEMSHPAITKKFDKEFLISSFKTMLEGNDELTVSFNPIEASAYNVSEIFETKEKTKYAFVSYPLSINMEFLKQKFDEKTKNMMKNMMKMQEMDVKFLTDSSLVMDKKAMTVAINDASTNNIWKYINHDENNPMYIEVVPVEIIKKAKEYKSAMLVQKAEEKVMKQSDLQTTPTTPTAKVSPKKKTKKK